LNPKFESVVSAVAAGFEKTKTLPSFERSAILVNEIPAFRVDSMPYGGVKESGLGCLSCTPPRADRMSSGLFLGGISDYPDPA